MEPAGQPAVPVGDTVGGVVGDQLGVGRSVGAALGLDEGPGVGGSDGETVVGAGVVSSAVGVGVGSWVGAVVGTAVVGGGRVVARWMVGAAVETLGPSDGLRDGKGGGDGGRQGESQRSGHVSRSDAMWQFSSEMVRQTSGWVHAGGGSCDCAVVATSKAQSTTVCLRAGAMLKIYCQSLSFFKLQITNSNL